MRAVLDTNVLIRALMNPAGTWGQVTARYREYRQVMSPAVAEELLRIARRPRLEKQRNVAAALNIVNHAEMVLPSTIPKVCRDEDDDKFFACALAGRADYIVSEDADVLAVTEYEGVRTIRTAAFLKLLDEAAQ